MSLNLEWKRQEVVDSERGDDESDEFSMSSLVGSGALGIN